MTKLHIIHLETLVMSVCILFAHRFSLLWQCAPISLSWFRRCTHLLWHQPSRNTGQCSEKGQYHINGSVNASCEIVPHKYLREFQDSFCLSSGWQATEQPERIDSDIFESTTTLKCHVYTELWLSQCNHFFSTGPEADMNHFYENTVRNGQNLQSLLNLQ